MDRKYIGILIIAVGVLALGFMGYLIFGGWIDDPVPSTGLQVIDTPSSTQVVKPIIEEPTTTGPVEEFKKKRTLNVGDSTKIIPQPTIQKVSEGELLRMAASFAERFGSYSNQSNFTNIKDLQFFMSSKMQKWSDDYIAKYSKNRPVSDIYFGISTKAMSYSMTDFDEDGGMAEALVRTIRRESTGTTNNVSSFFQDVSVNFVKEKDVWKVDSATWHSK